MMVHPLGDGGVAGQLFWAVLGQVGVSTSIGLDPVCILRACYSAAGEGTWKAFVGLRV
jgi:hypothetical protein